MARHRGLRAELASILCVDQYTQDDILDDPPPPPDAVSTRLAHLIAHASHHHSDARTLQAFLPVLMLRFFGYTSGQGWLETISILPFKDREALISIVLPDGPLHAFCKLNSPQSSSHHSSSSPTTSVAHSDMRFEFSVNNLPADTRAALAAARSSLATTAHSYLAPYLESYLKPQAADFVLLSPLDYFFVCMVASPANKFTADGTQEGVNPITNKRIKRSTSLPSTRALYNQVIAAYAATLVSTDRADNGTIFLPAILDFLFVPYALASPDANLTFSASAADAAASILLSLVPQTPDALDLEMAPSLTTPISTADLKLLSNTAALYRFVPQMLHNLFLSLARNDRNTMPFIAYLRILTLYLAPWRGPIRDGLRVLLFPKPRAPSLSSLTGRSTGLHTLSSTLSSMGAHLASPERSPSNASHTKESRWRSALASRQIAVDRVLLRLAVVRAPAQRVASASDGSRTLMLLSDAALSARLPTDPSTTNDEEVALCLDALHAQRSQSEQRGGKWERNYIVQLANALGARAPSSGVLAGISDIVSGGAQSVRGVVDKVSGRPGGSPDSMGRVRERRARALSGGVLRSEVPFFGSVWDRPIAQGEWETMVLMSYWVALRLEPVLGYVPDMRFLGRIWVWALVGVMVTMYVCVSTMIGLLT